MTHHRLRTGLELPIVVYGESLRSSCMAEPMCLDSTTQLADHPFTHPDQTVRDLDILCLILAHLRHLHDAPLPLSARIPPMTIPWDMQADCPHRIVIGNPSLLWTAEDLELVGFFGQRRTNADFTSLATSDEELLFEFTNHPGMICYVSYQLPCGNYGNLVLFHSLASKLEWSQSTRHAYVARVLSPSFYHSVCLHNGRLPGGIVGGQRPLLSRTKYFDYDGLTASGEPWRAVRIYEEASQTAVSLDRFSPHSVDYSQ